MFSLHFEVSLFILRFNIGFMLVFFFFFLVDRFVDAKEVSPFADIADIVVV